MPTTLTFPVLRMAYQDATGTSHPAAVWYLASISQDAIDLQAGLQFYGYDADVDLIADLEAALAHAGHTFSPIAQKFYGLTMPQFATFANAPGQAGATLMSSEFEDAVQFAQTTLDTPVLDTGGNPSRDASGNPVMQSFFAGAVAGTVTVTVPGS